MTHPWPRGAGVVAWDSVLLLLLVLLLAHCCCCYGLSSVQSNRRETTVTVIYVHAQKGCDENDGVTPHTAFKTIEKARDTAARVVAKYRASRAISTMGQYDNSNPAKHWQQRQQTGRDPQRVFTRGVMVYLAGSFFLGSPLVFDSSHSGLPDFPVVYRGISGAEVKDQDKVSLAGGVLITNWTIADAQKGIWQAPLPSSVPEVRQIYVDGVRATRPQTGTPLPGSVEKTSFGYITNDTSIMQWYDPSRLECIYTGSGAPWTQGRCGIDRLHLRKNATTGQDEVSVIMKQPCFTYGHHRVAPPQYINLIISTKMLLYNNTEFPTSIENVSELLGKARREFYIDMADRVIYYAADFNQDMRQATVLAPVSFVLINSTEQTDVRFEDLTFEYVGWTDPSGPNGYIDMQAGVRILGTVADIETVPTPAHLEFHGSKRITFLRCTFQHMGATALALIDGSQFNIVSGNTFTDISATALQIGQISAPQQTNPNLWDGYTLVYNNYIHHTAVEYWGNCGIFAGYVLNTTIIHNELGWLPYTGISLGWGWGTNSFAKNNKVLNNYVHDHMLGLIDGGAIYTLSAQPNSVVSGNYIHHQGHFYGALYHDEGSAYFHTFNNVVSDVQEWLHIWIKTIHDIVVDDCYSDQKYYVNHGTNITIANITYLTPGTPWPAGALDIIWNAGLVPASH